MVKIANKEVLQSYILTTAKYDFTVYEKRVLYRLVELAQSEVEGLKFINDCIKVQHDLFGFLNITLPIASVLNGENDKNHKLVKDALQSLQKKLIVYEDEEIWESISIIAFPVIKKNATTVSFTLHPKIWDCILDFSKGFRKYELKTAMSFTSEYSMRFYELLSGQISPITYRIENLKEMFQIQNKYKQINDFLRFVIETAKKELDEKSPYSFDYEINKKGRSFHSITFYPIQQPKNENAELKGHNLAKKMPLSWELTKEEINYLQEVYNAKKLSIKNNLDTFIQLKKIEGYLVPFLAELKTKMLRDTSVKNKFGYLINSIKNRLQEEQQHTPKIEKNNQKRKTTGGEFTSIGDLFSTVKKEK